MKHPLILALLLVSLTAACGDRMHARSDEASQTSAVEALDVAAAPVPAAQPAYGVGSGATPREQAAPPTQLEMAAADTIAVAAPAPGTVPGGAAVSLNPMLVRTGQAVLEVDSLEEGIARVRALAQRMGGIVGNTTISAGTEETRRADVELRIPSARFDEAVGGLTPIGRVETVNVSAEDVGEEYTDVSARVANARRLESRLLDLLESRSGRLEEILNVEREVARVREEIERYEGRLRYLRTRASVSVLTVTLHEPQTVMGARPGDRPIRDAFGIAWRNFVDLVAGLIASLGILVPLGFLGYLAWRVFRWLRRREGERDAAYREALRRDRDRATTPDEPAARP
ncbi:MAG TPA: DUF4349 domain-containing protein [Longimicrobium sp.]|nr:DUF4349 domain-containing protein [Longimicrobium sp.]